MKKLTLLFILMACCTFAINKITIPQRATVGATITASKTNENLDTIASKFNKLVDTLEYDFVRFSDVKDSTFQKINVDTIRSNPNIDSIKGSPYINAIKTDSSRHRVIVSDSATIPVFKGTEAHRDSAYFASGLRTLRLYTPQAKIDSLVGDVSISGNLGVGRTFVNSGSSYRTLFVGNSALLMGNTTNVSGSFYLGSNIYYGNASWRALYNGGSALMTGNSTKTFAWYFGDSASSGTGIDLEEKMKLDTNGLSVNGNVTALRLYTPQADIDSLVGPLSLTNKLRITGSTNSSPALNIENDFTSSSFQWTPNTNEGLCILTGRGQTPKSYATLLLANSKPDTVEPLGYLGFGHPTTSKSGNITGWKAYIVSNAVGSGGSVGGYGGEMSFFTRGDNASDLSEAMRITSTQNVGIGTTSPTERLSVNGNVTASGFIGPLTGNVTGNVSGSSGTCTGNAATVTNGVYTNGSYSNPSWITSLAGSKISGDISGNAATATVADSIKPLRWYKDTTYTSGVQYGFSTSPTITLRAIKIGKVVTLMIYAISGTSNGGNNFGGSYTATGINASSSNIKIPVAARHITDNSNVITQGGYIDMRTNGAFYILKDDNSVFSGNTGLSGPIVVTYVTN